MTFQTSDLPKLQRMIRGHWALIIKQPAMLCNLLLLLPIYTILQVWNELLGRALWVLFCYNLYNLYIIFCITSCRFSQMRTKKNRICFKQWQKIAYNKIDWKLSSFTLRSCSDLYWWELKVVKFRFSDKNIFMTTWP